MQKKIILDSELDTWLLRNKEALLLKSTFPHFDSVKKYIKKDEQVLEIGSSFGYSINYLQKSLGCKGYGLEPSALAVEKSYSHDERIKIRKINYPSLFCSFPSYFQAGKSSWSHSEEIFHTNMDERCSTVTLFKEF